MRTGVVARRWAVDWPEDPPCEVYEVLGTGEGLPQVEDPSKLPMNLAIAPRQ